MTNKKLYSLTRPVPQCTGCPNNDGDKCRVLRSPAAQFARAGCCFARVTRAQASEGDEAYK